MRTKTLKLIAFTLGASASLAQAGTNGFVVPFFRGSAASEAGYWETFTVASGAPGNLPDRAPATTGAVLTQSDTNAFLTGSGNIYNMNGVSAFLIEDSTPFIVGTVVLQARTLGGELDYGSAMLNFSDGVGERSIEPLQRVELNRGSQPGLGATVSSLWQWDLSGLNVTNYSISFRAAKASVSLDSVTLDTSNEFEPLFTQPFNVRNGAPSIERWMYVNNAAPCDRPAGAVFGTFGDAAAVDTRHAQHLVGWDTASLIATNRGPARYLLRRCRITLTINRGNTFVYDPTQDEFQTFFETNHPGYVPDTDAGRPVELFGAGYRNGFESASFDQCSPFGLNALAQRNAFAAGFSTNGVLVDVSNNVGKTNAAFPPFEVAPFAIGQTTNAAPGQLVPAGAKISFDLNLNDPFVLAYVQSGLNSGRLRFMVSSLHVTGGQFGAPSYPDFATRFNEATVEPTQLELEGVAIGNGDADGDGLPDDWELFNLNTLTHDAAADPDGDSASNLVELRAGTHPQDSASTLRLTSMQAFDGGMTLQFPHVANHRYTIEFSDDFNLWQRIANPSLLYSTPATAQWFDDGSMTGGPNTKRFYRIAVDQP